MHLAVIGASGVLARNVIPRLIEQGHAVRGLVHRPESAAVVKAMGAAPVAGDIFDQGSLVRAIDGAEAVINLATSVPRPGTPNPDFSRNARMRREGAAILVAACREAGVKHLIQQSIAMGMHSTGDAFTDESAPLPMIPANEAVIAMEDAVRGSGLDWCILRGGGFYGPGTGYDAEWRALARGGRLAYPGDGGNWVSLIHVADMGTAVVAALDRPAWGEVLAVVDDEPVTRRALFEHVAALESAPAPMGSADPRPPSFRVFNARIKRTLGWAPMFTSYRFGLAAAAGTEL
jgi:nucleoside-diphosphate-sugar epimerase